MIPDGSGRRLWNWMWEQLDALGAPAGELIDWVQTFDPSARALLAGLAALLETNIVTGLAVPGDLVMLVASAAVASVGEGLLLGVCVSVGAFTGEVSGYWLGRWARRGARRHGWLRRRAGRERSGRIAREVERRGGPWILAARFIPVFRTVTPFVVGLNGFPFRRFVAWAAPSCVLWSAVFVTLYAVASSSLREEGGSPVVGGILVMLGVSLFALAFFAQRLLERARADADEESDDEQVA
ncbi:MAG: DedA family protein [Aeromicrobium sp.]|uniref:DedA family protein n=1 Tax=Aeromicrobium sp. TaxID=1871063 RepID=UPI0039E640EE